MNIGVKLYTVKDGYELGDNIQSKVQAFAFGLSAEIERNLISQRRVIVNCCGLKKSVFFIRQPSFVHRQQKLYSWRQVQVV